MADPTRARIEGGCLCGAVRYRITSNPIVVTHCHCIDCRKSSGAPYVTWAELPPGAFELTAGEPKIHETTSDAGLRAQRHFCGHCGSLLTYRRPDTDQGIDVTAATFDDPDSVDPTDEVWTVRKLRWVTTGELANRHPRGRSRPSSGKHARRSAGC
jgi:hypothetical protein